jgi:hypothetical protein
MEPENSLPCSQEPSTDPYPEPDQSTPSYLSKIHSNIILPPTLGLPSGLFPSGFPPKSYMHSSPIRATCPAHLILPKISN